MAYLFENCIYFLCGVRMNSVCVCWENNPLSDIPCPELKKLHCVYFFKYKIALFSPGYPRTLYVAQGGLELSTVLPINLQTTMVIVRPSHSVEE